jgi:hypothetical protein
MPPSPSSSTRPVSISAHVEALTKIEDEPECEDQSCGAILSRIRSSIVSESGTRSSASARHISATPSRVESPYSDRKISISSGLAAPRTASTSPAAQFEIAARESAERPASPTSRARAASSSGR